MGDCMKKILFCYFSQESSDYTPTDIGYVIATIHNDLKSEYDFEMQGITYKRDPGKTKEDIRLARKKVISADVEAILSKKPDAVFIFVESVLWSKTFAFGRAKRVAAKIRARNPDVFLGVCGYKIQNFQAREVVEAGTFDCVVVGDQEQAFKSLPLILNRQSVFGVTYRETSEDEPTPCGPLHIPADETSSLDHIPSPYLEHVFDDFLRSKQHQTQGTFRGFLSSSRGCQFSCFYCARSVKFEKVRYFSAKRFYDEMEYLVDNFRIMRFFVLDDAFLCSKKRLSELRQEYEKRKELNPALKYVSLFVMARPETIDEEVVDYLSLLRVNYLQIGLQTINPALGVYMGRGKKVDIAYFQKVNEWLSTRNIRLHLDVILGLPGDTVEMFKATLNFATSLTPYSLQLKQLYINPYTLFHVNSKDYGIVADSKRKASDADFDAPYVIEATGIDEDYFRETNEFIIEQIDEHPDIRWKYLSKRHRFLSPGFYRKIEQTKE